MDVLAAGLGGAALARDGYGVTMVESGTEPATGASAATLPPDTRFVLLVNAAAGTGLAPRRLGALLGRHPAIAARARVVATTSLGDIDRALDTLAPHETPVAVGGDGSLNALLVRTMARDATMPVGTIPFGTGNAVAAALGLRSPDAAMRALDTGALRALDVMRTDHPRAPLALVSCSAGFEAAFLTRYGALRYRSRQWAGWSALLGNLPRRWRDVRVTCDAVPLVAPGDAVHNAGCYVVPTYAFGKIMWPGLAIDDGTAIAAAARDVAAYWTLIARGAPLPPPGVTITRLGVRTRRWSSAVVESASGVQIDGEAIGACAVSLRVVPSAVRVVGASVRRATDGTMLSA